MIALKLSGLSGASPYLARVFRLVTSTSFFRLVPSKSFQALSSASLQTRALNIIVQTLSGASIQTLSGASIQTRALNIIPRYYLALSGASLQTRALYIIPSNTIYFIIWLPSTSFHATQFIPIAFILVQLKNKYTLANADRK